MVGFFLELELVVLVLLTTDLSGVGSDPERCARLRLSPCFDLDFGLLLLVVILDVAKDRFFAEFDKRFTRGLQCVKLIHFW